MNKGAKLIYSRNLLNHMDSDKMKSSLSTLIKLNKKPRMHFSDQSNSETNLDEFETLKKKMSIESPPFVQEQIPLEERIVNEIMLQLGVRPYRINSWLYTKVGEKISQIRQNANTTDLVEEMNNCNVQLSYKEVGSSEGNNTMFMRHAFSTINYYYQKCDEFKKKEAKQHLRLKLFECDDSFLDCGLHPWGLLQCQSTQPLISKLDFSAVFVSPMCRAIQTCIELYKNHPTKDKIQFFVHEDLGEMIKKDSDIFDIEKFNAQIEEAQKLGINFDVKKFYKSDWQSHLIDKEYNIKRILSLPHMPILTPLQVKFILLKIFPQPLEKYSNFTKRCIRARNEIQETKLTLKGRVGIISHSLVQKNIFESIEGFNSKMEFENVQPVFLNL